MTRFFVRAPRQEKLTVIRDDNGIAREVKTLEPHSATQISFDGKTLEADADGRFEVSQEEHDRLVGQQGFESAGSEKDAEKKAPVEAETTGLAEPDKGPVELDAKKPAAKKPRASKKDKA